jgi:predicted pyridoxine 5'-phosphate oxidase superfamily flavin-nucleotide-binding protein
MISGTVRSFLAKLPYLFVASADESGQPHMAIGEQVTVSGASLLVFENWFCPATLQNIARNPRVSVVAVESASGKGYQLIGAVVGSDVVSVLDGYVPDEKVREIPQAMTRFTVRIDKVFAFAGGVHSDAPIDE